MALNYPEICHVLLLMKNLFAGTADEMNIVTYIAVICGGLAVVVILLSVIYFLWWVNCNISTKYTAWL